MDLWFVNVWGLFFSKGAIFWMLVEKHPQSRKSKFFCAELAVALCCTRASNTGVRSSDGCHGFHRGAYA